MWLVVFGAIVCELNAVCTAKMYAPMTPGGLSLCSMNTNASGTTIRVASSDTLDMRPCLPPSGNNVGCLPGATVGPSLATFTCKRCGLVVPFSEMDASKPGNCKKDILSYKSLCDRWSRNRSLKVWWDALPDHETHLWYRKQHALATSVKRKFEITYADESRKNAHDVADAIDR